ncbi:MAG: T9SS C-terminal target domain-containing protein [Calditrichaeota bacterium]|nr:MAG: T9SS C-terminal target domain-containing protein [Calditrichota bacterium]
MYQAGGPFGDNNDADTDSLVAQIVERPLLDITFSGGMYHLEGPYADIVDIEAPFEGEFSRSDSLWQFTRSPQEFEAANVYFHVDKSMRYINETLGFSLMPFQYPGGVQGDPHGLGGADNSHYISSTGQLAWGEGGVDDSEDPDVILHELGHGIHDWITNGNLSQVHGLSEGSGDYWAASYNRSLGFWTPADPQYFWVFQWDGHNEFWPGRITNYTATFPGGLTGQIHTDGQMWSSTLMQIWDDIGREATDSDFLEALSMTNANSGQDDAAQAFVQADINLYGGAHLWSIEQWFTQRGYPITIPVPQIAHDPLHDTEDLTGPYPVTATISAAFPLAEVKLIYGTDGVFTDTTDMIPNGNQYSADIPGTGVPTHYNYYIFAADTAGLASTHPPGAPQNYHAFFAGPDTIPPVIQHSPLGDQALVTWPAQVEAHISDNLGIADALVEYSLNDSLTGSFSLANVTGDLYQGVFDIDSSALSIGDTIAYRIIATDASAAGNQTVDPPTGFHRFAIVDILGRILIIDDDPATGKTAGMTEKGAFRRQVSESLFGASADQMARWLSDMSYLVTVEDVNNTDPNQWGEYDLLISSSGFNFDPVSDATYRMALETYVGDTTHKLLVEGGEVGYDATSFPGYPTFAANVLHSDDWDADNAGPLNLVSGYANHPLVTTPNQLPSQMPIIYTDWPSEDAVTAIGGAYVVYEPQSYPGDAGISIYDNNQDPRSAQIVFFAFNFAELADSNAARDLLENAVKYLLTPEGTPGGNTAPSPVHLLLPADGDTLSTFPIEFRWTASQDPEGDTLLYHLEIFNDSMGVAVDSIGDTTYVFDGTILTLNTAYRWTVSVTDGQLVTASPDTFTFITPVVGIDPKRPGIPARFALHANFPNPFNPTTTIRYDLKETVRVRLRIFNLLGQVVRTLVDGRETAGYKEVVWDGRNDAGEPVASGVYLYRLEAGNPSAGSGHGFVKTRKMVLIR